MKITSSEDNQSSAHWVENEDEEDDDEYQIVFRILKSELLRFFLLYLVQISSEKQRVNAICSMYTTVGWSIYSHDVNHIAVDVWADFDRYAKHNVD